MNPNATPFKPSVSKQEIRLFESIPSVVENLYFDNLEKEFVKNNPWIFADEDANNEEANNKDAKSEDAKSEDAKSEDAKSKDFTIQNKNNENIHITFNS